MCAYCPYMQTREDPCVSATVCSLPHEWTACQICYWVTILLLWPLGKFEASEMLSLFCVWFLIFCLDDFRSFKILILKRRTRTWPDLGQSLLLLPGTEYYLVSSFSFLSACGSFFPANVWYFHPFHFFVPCKINCRSISVLSPIHSAFLSSSSEFSLSFVLEGGWRKCFLLIDSTVYFFLWGFKFCYWICIFSKETQLFPKETQLPLDTAPSSAVPSLFFTRNPHRFSGILFPRGHIFSSPENTTVSLIIFQE